MFQISRSSSMIAMKLIFVLLPHCIASRSLSRIINSRYIFRWTEILEDLHMESPYYYDIRKPDKGVFKKNTKKRGTNLHCIIAFHKA